MSQLAGLQFGSGIVLAAPTGGNLAANPTPLEVGVVQNVKMTLGAEIKELYGQVQWSVDSAVGKRSIKGSFEFAQLSNDLLSQLFFADPVTPAAVILTAYREAHEVPATTAYTVTVTNGAHFIADYGVTYASGANAGVPFEEVESVAAAGQYSVNLTTGVYTFDVADASANILISYQYSGTTGTTLTAGNHAMGFGPIVSLALVFPYDGIGIGFNLPNVRLGKVDFTTKIDDYAMISTDFSAFAGSANNPFTAFQAW